MSDGGRLRKRFPLAGRPEDTCRRDLDLTGYPTARPQAAPLLFPGKSMRKHWCWRQPGKMAEKWGLCTLRYGVNGSHFGFPPCSIHRSRITGLDGYFVWTTAWCGETWNSGASSDVREPIHCTRLYDVYAQAPYSSYKTNLWKAGQFFFLKRWLDEGAPCNY